MGTEETSPGVRLKSSITDASRKIESIIDDAERAAAEIRADARASAEREAQRIIRDSTSGLTEVMHPLIDRIENLRVEAAALLHEIETASLELNKLSGVEATAAVSTPPDPGTPPAPKAVEPPVPTPIERPTPVAAASAPGPTPVAYPGRTSSHSPGAAVPEEAVLRATQMAVAGSSRSEIETTLQDEFGLEDATPVVNDILGAD